jgi:hypothetical protein
VDQLGAGEEVFRPSYLNRFVRKSLYEGIFLRWRIPIN